MNKLFFSLVLSLLVFSLLSAQDIDLETIGKFERFKKKNPFKVTGNVSANAVYYSSNQNKSRDAFTYFAQGTLNFSLFDFSFPLSYNYSNMGDDLSYDLPFTFNRLSLHPRYKWVTAHIGDVSMDLSQYTFSHQFTGGGVELAPNGFEFKAFGGRLLKAVEADPENNQKGNFQRNGYGLKFGVKRKKFNLAVIGMYADEDVNSLKYFNPDQLTPKENLVLSSVLSFNMINNLKLDVEYASSAVTEDKTSRVLTDDEKSSSSITSLFFNNRTSTEYYKAYKLALGYTYRKYSLGVQYERIDPEYKTLGSYYFNNDFENITLNGSSVLYKGKLNLSFDLGFQNDDLNNQNDTKTSRFVGNVNGTYVFNKKITFSANYSNFSTYTNNRLNQFDDINDDNLLDNQQQQFNYQQLSQNANFNMNYAIKDTKVSKHNLNVNYSLATVANAENGVVRIGNGSTFHNLNSTYTIGFPEKKMNISTSFNGTINTIAKEDSKTFGPSLNINKQYFDGALNTTFGTSFNYNDGGGGSSGSSNVLNFRLNGNYVYNKKHNFNLSAVQLFRNQKLRKSRDLTLTFSYSYAFGLSYKKKKKDKKKKVKKKELESKDTIRHKEVLVKTKKVDKPKKIKKVKPKKVRKWKVEYKENTFIGDKESINEQIDKYAISEEYSRVFQVDLIKDKLQVLRDAMDDATSKSKYKKAAVAYLKSLSSYKDYLDVFYDLAFKGLKQLYNDAVRLERRVEKRYINAKLQYDEAVEVSKKLEKYYKTRKEAYFANSYLINKLENVKYNDLLTEKILLDFRDAHINKVFEMLENQVPEQEVFNYLEVEFAKMYHKLANKK